MARLLVISPVSTHPPQSGARRRIYTLLRTLKERGHRIHFLYVCSEQIDSRFVVEEMRGDWDTVDFFQGQTTYEKSQGEDYGLDDWIESQVCEAIGELARRYDITHCLTNYVFQTKYFDFLPEGVLKVLDCHDRLSRRQLYEQLGVDPGFFFTTEAEELRGLSRADVVLAIQDEEAEYFAQGGRPVVIIGHLEQTHYIERRFTEFKTLGYLGATNKFNIASLEAFLPAFSAYSTQLSAPLELRIAGNASVHFRGRSEFDLPHVSYDGKLPDVGSYMAGLDLYVNPTSSGTGLKIKSVEAMAYGLPIVSTRIGFEGLLALPDYHLAESVDDLLESIERVRIGGFGTLTKLSNFSKASFAEYQYNLRENVRRVFELAPAEVLAWAAESPRYIGSRHEENPTFTTLEQIDEPGALVDSCIAHVVNPVRMPRTSDLYVAQPIVFRALRRAQRSTTKTSALLVARRFPEDDGYLAECFDLELELHRSAADLGSAELNRKLPFVRDVFSLDGLPAHVTHVVYTNSDIGVLPFFYDLLADKFSEGFDAVVINRRTISKKFAAASDLSDALTDSGIQHPGFDCFAVSRQVLESSDFADTLVGAHLIGRVVLWNILARAKRIAYLDDHHCTFHVGDDVPSKDRSGFPYVAHNLLQGARVARALRANPGHLSDPKRQASFSRALGVSPGPMVGTFDAQTMPHRGVFLHAFFRTGTTYLYSKARKQAGWTCYYEPLHEDLALFSPERIDVFKEQHRNARFRHGDSANDDSDWLFAEYEPLLDSGISGVREFDRRLSYQHQFPGSEATLKAYLDQLIQSASTEHVLLQFNRTALRVEMLTQAFPQHTHLYLKRNLRDSWGSYLSFETGAVYGFLRNHLAFLCFNAGEALMRALAKFVPVVDVPYHFYFHTSFSQIFQHFTIDQHFLIHATFWHAALAQAQRAGLFVIDLEEVANDRLVRMEVEARLAYLGLNLSFDDVEHRTYPPQDLLLSEGTMEGLEVLARSIVAEAYGLEATPSPAQADAFVSAPSPQRIEELQELANRLSKREMANLIAAADTLCKRARRRSPVPAALEPGTKYAIAQLDELGVLAGGFHPSEGRHIWIDGKVGLFRFRRARAATLDVVLYCHSHPLMTHRSFGTHVLVNGHHLETILLGSDRQPYRVRIPDDLVDDSGVVELVLATPRYFAGRRVRSRDLSICVSNLVVDAKAQPAHPSCAP